MRIIIIEPNLCSCTGHPYTTVKEMAIKKFVISQCFPSCKEIHFIGNKNCTDELHSEIPDLENYATKTCFETGNWKDLINYIKVIIEEFNLRSEDLVIFTTAHLNEINAVKFLSKEKDSPRFLLQIHQFYKPLPNSSQIYDLEVKEHFRKLFSDAFEGMAWSKVQIATTNVMKFNELLSNIAGRKLLVLPLILAQSCSEDLKKFDNSANNFRLGFLGDGRKEKGLLEVLRVAERIVQRFVDTTLLINVQNPRYFSKEEISELNNLTKFLKECDNVEILEGPLNAQKHFRTLNSLNAVILPYDPEDYQIRLSAIACECGLLGIPIIATKSSSIGDWIEKKQISGITYEKGSNRNESEANLIGAINILKNSYSSYKNFAQSRRSFYQENTSVEHYFEEIFKFYKTKYA